MRIAAIVAAGGGRRMGVPKALLQLADGRTLAQAHVDALAPWADEVRIVLGAAAPPVRGARVVRNPEWARSAMVDSLVLCLEGADEALVTPVDALPAAGADLGALCAAPLPSVLAWQGRPGHPARIGPREIQALPCPGGLRAVLDRAARVPAGSARVLVDLDTPADLATWGISVPRTGA